MANLGRWQAYITDNTGAVLANATVTVRSETTGLLVSLYTDRAGTVAAGNPILSDANGFAYFHVPGGAYRIQVTSGSYSADLRYVAIGNAAESDLSNGTFTLTASATSTDVVDDACTTTSVVVPKATTANAAAGMATLRIVEGAGTFTVYHANNSLTDRTYEYVIRTSV